MVRNGCLRHKESSTQLNVCDLATSSNMTLNGYVTQPLATLSGDKFKKYKTLGLLCYERGKYSLQ